MVDGSNQITQNKKNVLDFNVTDSIISGMCPQPQFSIFPAIMMSFALSSRFGGVIETGGGSTRTV